MAQLLTSAEIVTEVYRNIDQSSSNTRLESSDIPAYVNRELESIGHSMPTRTVRWTLTGNGSSIDFDSPEVISNLHIILGDQVPQPKTSFAATLRSANYFILTSSESISRGVSLRLVGDKIRARVEPVMDSNTTRDIYFLGLPGSIRETPYTTGTISAVTADSAVITGSGTTWTSNARAGDSILIGSTTSTVGGDYYVIKSIDSNTQITLTEAYRGTTVSSGAAKLYTIGGSTGLNASFNELLILGAQWRVERKLSYPQWQETKALYRQLFWEVAGQQEKLFASDPYLGWR